MKKSNSEIISHLVGKGLAHIQDGCDQICLWGFRKLKQIDKKDVPKDENTVIKASRKVGGFLGTIGSEYFEEYENLKKKRK